MTMRRNDVGGNGTSPKSDQESQAGKFWTIVATGEQGIRTPFEPLTWQNVTQWPSENASPTQVTPRKSPSVWQSAQDRSNRTIRAGRRTAAVRAGQGFVTGSKQIPYFASADIRG
jgi:hypothetical protein